MKGGAQMQVAHVKQCVDKNEWSYKQRDAKMQWGRKTLLASISNDSTIKMRNRCICFSMAYIFPNNDFSTRYINAYFKPDETITRAVYHLKEINLYGEIFVVDKRTRHTMIAPARRTHERTIKNTHELSNLTYLCYIQRRDFYNLNVEGIVGVCDPTAWIITGIRAWISNHTIILFGL